MNEPKRQNLVSRVVNVTGHNAVWDSIRYVCRLASDNWRMITTMLAAGLTGVDTYTPISYSALGEYVFVFIKIVFATAVLYYLASIRCRWQRWNLVRFGSDSRVRAFDPILRVKHAVRRGKFVPERIRQCIGKFTTQEGGPYYKFKQGAIDGIGSDDIQENERPYIVLKLPVRMYLAIPDLVDLRMLRKLYARGSKVMVVLLDVPIGIETSDIPRARESTIWFVRRILGSGPRVEILSQLLSKMHGEFIRYLLDDYLPSLASQSSAEQPTRTEEFSTDKISHFTFPLICRAVQNTLGSDEPLVFVQWAARAEKWKKSRSHTSRWPDMRVGGFILGETFRDCHGVKWPAATRPIDELTFHATDTGSDISEKILKKLGTDSEDWKIPDYYIRFLGKTVLGWSSTEQTDNSGETTTRKILAGQLSEVSSQLWKNKPQK